MADDDACHIVKAIGQGLRDVDAAVLSAGAADGDRQVVAVLGFVRRKPTTDKAFDVVDHRGDFRLLFHKVDDGLIESREGSQRRIVVGIREVSHVK